MNDFIMIFNNTHEAMEGESVFKNNNLRFMIMPTPTYITKSCGISIRFSEEVINNVEKLIEDKAINFKNIYKRGQEGFIIYK